MFVETMNDGLAAVDESGSVTSDILTSKPISTEEALIRGIGRGFCVDLGT
jgi:hypothetical protein